MVIGQFQYLIGVDMGPSLALDWVAKRKCFAFRCVIRAGECWQGTLALRYCRRFIRDVQ